MSRQRKFYGWGFVGEEMTAAEEDAALANFRRLFAVDRFQARQAPSLDLLRLPVPRIAPPAVLATVCATAPYERALHSFGKSYPDTVRGLQGDYAEAPDIVAYPRNESEVAEVIDWAGSHTLSITPFGGGSSVVGGVAPIRGSGAKGTISLDLSRLNRVLEIDHTSRSARIEAGIFGPELESALKPHGLTLRHFPQSYEHSTLGGWIATRSGGHYASLHTHIDDFVESVRLVTPRGVLQTRRLPASGAGPNPAGLFIGSEGILGVITEAWMRITPRPRHRCGASLWFADFFKAASALRALLQAGLTPSNCRVLDPEEVRNTASGDGRAALLILGFEGWDGPLDDQLSRALTLAKDHGGRAEDAAPGQGAAGRWRTAFIRMPYARERMVPRAIISDTFETAITWDRFDALHAAVTKATLDAIREATGRHGQITCRITHVYPDGPAPYFSFHALGRDGTLIEQWQAIKNAASDALIAAGGTITHHHAVGRDHRPWYDKERPQLFATALAAAKSALDPGSLLNPGVLIGP